MCNPYSPLIGRRIILPSLSITRYKGLNDKYNTFKASTGLVVMGGDSCYEGHVFESQHRILDVNFNTFIR